MPIEFPPEPAGETVDAKPLPAWVRFLHQAENWLLALILALMVLLPLQELAIALINFLAQKANPDFFWQGISGSIPMVQHLVLILGLLGAALAARQKRLLSLSTLTTFLKGRSKLVVSILSNAFAVAVTVLLCVGSLKFVLVEKEAGEILVYNVPTWVVELILPLGFGLVAARLWWHSANAWWGRLITLALAGSLIAIGLWSPFDPEQLRLPALIGLGVATLLGAPLFTALGGAALILFWSYGEPIANLAVDHYQMSVHPMLPTIPLFTLVGYLLAEGGASQRLIRVFHSLVGHFRGGEAMLTVLVCAFFTSFTGASGVTILALGAVLMPVLLAARFSERSALGLLTGAGSIGLLFPPCIPLILYAIVASNILKNIGSAPALPLDSLNNLDLNSLDIDALLNAPAAAAPATTEVTIESMFLAGLIPGLLLVLLACVWGRMKDARSRGDRPAFNAKELRAAAWKAKWELFIPVVAFGAIFGGFASTVQAAALTAFYTFVVEVWIYRDLKIFKDLPRVMAECGLLVGGVLVILGVAQGFNNFLISEEIPQHLLDWVKQSVESPLVFLLLLNLFLLAVGCLMDIYSAIIIVVPMIIPMGIAFKIDPVHLGIIFLANLELGYLTPPVGINLILSSYRFNKPILKIALYSLPMFLVILIGVLLITYIPQLTTFLPGLLK